MKLSLLLVSIIAFLIVDCRHDERRISIDGSLDHDFSYVRERSDSIDEAQQLKERPVQLPSHVFPYVRERRNTSDEDQDPDFHFGRERKDSAGEDQQEQPNEEEKGQSERKLTRANCRGRPKIQCSILGGYCVGSGEYCYGRLVKSGCTGNCECCIPTFPDCPGELGFFSPPGTKQCFKYFPFGQYNWFQAKEKCQAEGLELPHPYDALKLRSYIVQRFGSSHYAFVNARGDGSGFVWQDNNAKFEADNPFMRRNPPAPITDKYCVMITPTAQIWKPHPLQVYEYQHCDWRGTAPLCELVLEKPFHQEH